MTSLEIPEIKIFLNIYDINPLNNYFHSFGLGAYHTGIQFFDTEFAFGFHSGSHSGVYESEPRQSVQGKYRESICLGTTHLSVEEILDAIEELKIEYIGCSYDIFRKNCNHFSNDLSIRLTNKSIPKYLNRLAGISYYIRCLIPQSIMNANNPMPSNIRHHKKDSMKLNSKRIRKHRKLQTDTQNQSQGERLSLTNHDEKNESNIS